MLAADNKLGSTLVFLNPKKRVVLLITKPRIPTTNTYTNFPLLALSSSGILDYIISNVNTVTASKNASIENGSLLLSNSKPNIASKWILIQLSYRPQKKVITNAR
jgi:hypothetical protein